jgi:polar amino acid transport system substrate-binding protein
VSGRRAAAAALVALALALAPPAAPAAGVLRVCADPDNLPVSSAGRGDRGLYVELAELVAAKLGRRAEYTWWRTDYAKRALRSTLLAHDCDVFFGLPARGDFMPGSLTLTGAFLDVGYALAAPAARGLTSLDGVGGGSVAVAFRSPPQLLLAERADIRAVTFRGDEEALDALARGAVDAAFVWGPVAGYYNRTRLGGRLRIVPVAGEGLQWRVAAGLRKGDAALRAEVETALAALAPEITALAARYGFPAAAATPPAAGADDVAAGRTTFNQHCARCHSPNAASPEPSQDLRRLTRRYGSGGRERFDTAVAEGRPDKGMPGWREVLTPEVIGSIWRFLESVQVTGGELRLFVTNERSNDVTVYEAASGRLLATIPVGRRPRGVVGSPDGRTVFVASSDADEVTVIDAARLAVVATLPAGRDPEGLALNRDGTRLYAVNENEQAVTVLEIPGGRRVATIPVGTEPETAVLSPDGTRLAVSNETSNDVVFIDPRTDAVVGRTVVARNPRGMRFSGDSRRLYVACEQAHVVVVIDVASLRVVQSAPTGGERPVDVRLSRDGSRLWVSHGLSGDVRVLDAATLEVQAAIAVGPRAWWMAASPEGDRLYVTVGRANEVVVIDTVSGAVVRRLPAGTLPWGVAAVEVR